jgi:hypothetical protein
MPLLARFLIKSVAHIIRLAAEILLQGIPCGH